MRWLCPLALLIAAPMWAQSVKPVEVTNFPAVQDVSVVSGCSSPPLELVGFTSATMTGDGPLAFTRACQAEFPGSRVCTSEEIVKTRSVPENLSGVAWFVPTAEAAVGWLSRSPQTCNGWSSPSTIARVVNSKGAAITRVCNDHPAAVACCGVPQ